VIDKNQFANMMGDKDQLANQKPDHANMRDAMNNSEDAQRERGIRHAVETSHESAKYFFNIYFRNAMAWSHELERSRDEAKHWRHWAMIWWALAVLSNVAMWVEVWRHAK
jgi:hypothetical protein